jgi:hypothetical protein
MNNKDNEINIRLERVFNGVIFTNLNNNNKKSATRVFAEREDIYICRALGQCFYPILYEMNMLGADIELNIKVKKI